MPKKKLRKRQEQVIVEHRLITPKEWGRICAIPWTPATRPSIGALFASDGVGPANDILQGIWSRAMQINRTFIKHGLPYRVRGNPLPKEQLPAQTPYHIQTLELKLCVVTKTL